MGERIFIGVAWPYANGPLHLGHIAGAYLPADIFVRYHRIKGNEVLMVSGSDMHGTPITLRAEEEGKKPGEVANRYHQQFLESWQKLGIIFDLFTNTETVNHRAVSQDIFLTLLNKGYIYKATMSQPFCSKCRRFLPDRYLEGTCPYCQSPSARGDQCDTCGKPLNTIELVKPHCRTCGTPPQFKDSEHFFLKLTAFTDRLLSWVKQQTHWRPNVLNFTLSFLKEGLKDRAITRDIEWGISVPLPGYEGKRLYVWFEAVIGYLSASKEWAKSSGDETKWRPFWQGEGAKSYYFIGKDNIPFHTIIWPAMLMGYGDFKLPYDVPANEFLTIEGKKLSTSRNWAVWVLDYLERYDPDALRYLLSINMSETSDTDFSWRELIRRNNDELVATYGNLVHRALTFAYRNFDGCVPPAGVLDSQSRALLGQAEAIFKTVDELLYGCHFREAIRSALSLAQETNRYLDAQSPWKVIKTDRSKAATALYVVIGVVSQLKTMLYPFLPFSSQKLHEYLGFIGSVEDYGWGSHLPVPGQKLVLPQPLFTKLEETLAEIEASRLG
ncbi:MAG: methionine--tRNA ligase [Dehalococcoidales bacterium]|mgnify:FL=1|jgi:methionyl-tRNA synthetase|nr:methionine--tRNA ligase [Dehalococcoidales bacterium]MDP6737618.1 methionine--tRNA ligase [Dehalococcoidales bacterium]|tara:strand:+ start:603 stop:2264 length:1662 start_codon:yes stop_codon:yes gene_type:complete